MKKIINPSFHLLASSMLFSVGLYLIYIFYRLAHFYPAGDVSIYIPLYFPEYHPEIDIELYISGVIFVPMAGLLIYFCLKKLIGRFLPSAEKIIDWTVITATALLDVFIIGALLFKLRQVNAFLEALFKEENYIFFTGFSYWQLIVVSLVQLGFLILLYYKGKREYWWDLVVMAAITFLVSIVAVKGPFNPSFVITNFNPVIGPVNDVLGGKTLLVDINSQYGLFMIYALAALFKIIPLTYENFFLLNFATTVTAYFLLYLIMRKWLGQIAFFGIFLILLHHYFGGNINILLTCQQTFVRWGWWIILLAYFLFTSSFKNLNRLKLVGELLLLGIAVFWGFDTGIYTLGAYLGFTLTRIFVKEEGTRLKILDILKTIVGITGTLLLYYIFISAFTYLRAGVWADWGRFNVTSGQFMSGFGMLPMPPLGAYWIFLGFYLGVITYIIYKLFSWPLSTKEREELPLISFVVIYGVMQFLYYAGRSTPSYLTTISLPFILLLCWLFPKGKNQLLRLNLSFYPVVILIWLFLAVLNTIGAVNLYHAYINKTSLSELQFDKVGEQSGIKKSIDFINTYLDTSSGRNRKVTIVSNRDGFFLVKTKSVNVISSNHLDYFNRVAQFEELGRELLSKNPAVVFTDHENIYPMVPQVINVIREKYHFEKNVGYLDEWVRND